MPELLRFAKLHGVKAHKVDEENFRRALKIGKVVEAPFTSYLGIDWKGKGLYYTRDDQWVEMVHELGHLLASSVEPRKSTEWDFFGWEVAVIHHLGLSLDRWLAGNRDYGVDGGHELGGLTSIQLHKMLAERMDRAVACGLVDPEGVPLAIR